LRGKHIWTEEGHGHRWDETAASATARPRLRRRGVQNGPLQARDKVLPIAARSCHRRSLPPRSPAARGLKLAMDDTGWGRSVGQILRSRFVDNRVDVSLLVWLDFIEPPRARSSSSNVCIHIVLRPIARIFATGFRDSASSCAWASISPGSSMCSEPGRFARE